MEYIENVINSLTEIPLDNPDFLAHTGLLCLCIMILGILFRLFFGKQSNLNHVLSAAIGILFLYIIGILLYHTEFTIKSPIPFLPFTLDIRLGTMLDSLPFVYVQEDMLTLFAFESAELHVICILLLKMVILAFFVNILDYVLPTGKNILSWLFFRFLTIILSVIIQSVLYWIFSAILPQVIFDYAPVLLLGIIVVTLFMGVIQLFLGVALTAVNPVIGGLYTFFFKSMVGRQLTNAVLTTTLLSLLVVFMRHLGYIMFSIPAMTFLALLPAIGGLLVIWYLVDQVL